MINFKSRNKKYTERGDDFKQSKVKSEKYYFDLEEKIK